MSSTMTILTILRIMSTALAELAVLVQGEPPSLCSLLTVSQIPFVIAIFIANNVQMQSKPVI